MFSSIRISEQFSKRGDLEDFANSASIPESYHNLIMDKFYDLVETGTDQEVEFRIAETEQYNPWVTRASKAAVPVGCLLTATAAMVSSAMAFHYLGKYFPPTGIGTLLFHLGTAMVGGAAGISPAIIYASSKLQLEFAIEDFLLSRAERNGTTNE